MDEHGDFDDLDSLTRRLASFLSAPASLRSAALTAPRVRPAPGDEAAALRVNVKPIALRGEAAFQFERRFAKKVTHLNVAPSELIDALARELSARFTQAIFYFDAETVHLTQAAQGTRGKGAWKMRRTPVALVKSGDASPVAGSALLDHNRAKNYLLPEGKPIPFLIRLGVMTAEGRVIAAKYDKFRQINRFLEMVADTLPALPAPDERVPLRVVDFGAGKSYLTFALYHFLHVTQGRSVQIVGLDRKRDVIDGGNRIAADLGWSDGLRFETGDIASYEGASAADLVVSLHACDTATDDALARAVAWNASVILAVPCCQHEINSKLDARNSIADGALRPLLKHGILKERLAALVTDALRAERLEAAGYKVQALEFIDMEHTPKNILLRATRRRSGTADPAASAAGREYAALRDFWGVAPYIDAAFTDISRKA